MQTFAEHLQSFLIKQGFNHSKHPTKNSSFYGNPEYFELLPPVTIKSSLAMVSLVENFFKMKKFETKEHCGVITVTKGNESVCKVTVTGFNVPVLAPVSADTGNLYVSIDY